jgi:RND superfamily putative drug exporter
MVPRLAAWCFRRRWLALILWIVFALSIVVIGKVAKGDYKADYAAPHSDSKIAQDILQSNNDARTGDTFDIVYKSPVGVNNPQFASQVSNFERQAIVLVEKTDAPKSLVKDSSGVRVSKPTAALGVAKVSKDGNVGIATVQTNFDQNYPPMKLGKQLVKLQKQYAKSLPAGSQIELSGQIPSTGEQKPGQSDAFGFIAAMIILFIAFGTLLAMGIPIGTAIISLMVASALIALMEHVVSVPNWAPIIASLIGIGVGIDYALFIVTRYRNSLSNGLNEYDSIVVAYNTAGRAVMFAGCTVVIALLGLTVMKLGYLYGVAFSASASVLVVMISSLTLLPAILGFAGQKINGFRQSTREKKAKQFADNPDSFWHRWSHGIQNHPWRAVVGSLIALFILTLPVLDLKLGFPDASNEPHGYTTHRAFMIEKAAVGAGFGPGSSAPIYVVAEPNGATQQQLNGLFSAVKSAKGIQLAIPAQLVAGQKTALVIAQPDTSPQDDITKTTLKNLRDSVVPQAVQGTPIVVHIGGLTAGYIDSSQYIADRLFLFIGAVVLLSFLLLMVVFRSILVPLKAAVMNLLSISAAYGVMAYAVNGSWLGHLMGIQNPTPVPSFVPMIMFAILFGLSMDYEVFLLTRIREEYNKTGNNKTAVADGLAHTARVITAAAAVMVCVFGAFMLDPNTFVKAIGLGLATAILVDATIVRLLLVPATMELLGDANWWYPKWLDRITPHFNIEPEDVVDLSPTPAEPVLAGVD